MATNEDLRKATLDELHRQVTEGVKVSDGEGGVETLSTPANILTASLAYLKQYPVEVDEGNTKANEISSTLRRFGKV